MVETKKKKCKFLLVKKGYWKRRRIFFENSCLGNAVTAVPTVPTHLCFRQAQLKMCHSPKVDDGVDIF